MQPEEITLNVNGVAVDLTTEHGLEIAKILDDLDAACDKLLPVFDEVHGSADGALG